jgi:cytidyltransferase-like protein
MGLIFMFYYD